MMSDGPSGLIECVNIPKTISAILEHKLRLATKYELDTIYGTEDLWDFLELITVHNYNQRMISKAQTSGI
ncbi:Uncharacterised protein [Serratia ficaria]|jgi:hypothetical protein|uniref:Uncharacterized protein n=1 Tax=Serratia ficaria TaxID=61651 RepID=A0A240BKB1_SERFI|nr:hypothetical protein C7332_4331 [Serratia ficaria]CAI0847767.1 Uncharacterised protein [Serratia ficaria]CAI1024975.1 Uncharacterised protein [Serratia ficaria]CAI1038348.1 Uncharacterised protein [Serratia ficaria]CAI2058422.1 Uncharacterised protein [Serratia ficaria]